MRLRPFVSAAIYLALVPLVGWTGPWGTPIAAAPSSVVEAPGVGEQAVAAVPGRAVSPMIVAGRLESRDASAGVAAAVADVARGGALPVWVVYTVPAVTRVGDRHGRRPQPDRCVLDENGFEHGNWTDDDRRTLRVFARVGAHGVDRVAVIAAGCTVDAGRQTVVRLDGVRPADSVRWLGDLVRTGASAAGHGDDASDERKGALAALALTDDPAADSALSDLVTPGHADWLRREAAFWLGAARGAAGAALVDRLIRSDTDEGFRQHLTFVLTLTGDRGLDTLIDRARHDESPQVRGQALFWLAHEAGERAAGTLSRAVDEDPDREVRKRAVFAISQLPRNEAVPKLIALAQTHRDAGVREQAMFWLGQSGDPRALDFFEGMLRR